MFEILLVGENLSVVYTWKKKIQSVLVDCQSGVGKTLRVKPLIWGHRSNFGSPEIWVVTALYQSQGYNNTLGSMLWVLCVL